MKKKNKPLIIVGIILIIISVKLWNIAFEQKIYCGTITHKINALEYNKHNATPDPILIVKFDGYGKHEIHTNWITFMDHEVGSRVCFTKKVSEVEDTPMEGGLSLLLSVFAFIVGVVLILWGFGVISMDSE